MDIFEQIIHISVGEATAKDLLRKQRSITRLFPSFPDRVKAVADKGGIRLAGVDDEQWHFKIHSGTKDSVWYDAYVRYNDLTSSLIKVIKDRRLWVKDKSRIDKRKMARKLMNIADIQISCSCLTGDTKVPLLDGRTLTMEELVKEYGKDKSFWVYSSDVNGDFVPAKAKCLGVTKQVNQLVEVELDNGEKIKCTPEHLFRLRDGSYLEAVELKAGDSLMPLYLKKSKPNSKYSCSYLKVKLNGRKGIDGRPIWKMVHRIVAETVLQIAREIKEELVRKTIEKFLVVHHKDINSFNNVPDNLEWLGKNEHWFLHANFDHTNSIRGTKLAWEDSEFRLKGIERNRKAGKISQEKKPENAKIFNQKGVEYMQSEEGGFFLRERNIKMWEEKREEIVLNLQKSQRKIRGKHSSTMLTTWEKGKLDKEVLRKRCLGFDHSGSNNPFANEDIKLIAFAGKVMQVCFALYRRGLELTQENYECARKETRSVHFEKFFGDIETVQSVFQLSLTREFDGKYRGFWKEDQITVLEIVRRNYYRVEKRVCPNCDTVFDAHPVSSQRLCSKRCRGYFAWHRNDVQKSLKNHKVISVKVINLDEGVPVYDLTVEKYQNFALSAGVFVHNCPADKYYGGHYIRSLDKYNAKQGDKETRPPKERNPKQYGMYCKHLQNLMKVLPFYTDTMMRWLDDFYSDEIRTFEEQTRKEYGWFKKIAGELKKKVEPDEEEPKIKAKKASSKGRKKTDKKEDEEPDDKKKDRKRRDTKEEDEPVDKKKEEEEKKKADREDRKNRREKDKEDREEQKKKDREDRKKEKSDKADEEEEESEE